MNYNNQSINKIVFKYSLNAFSLLFSFGAFAQVTTIDNIKVFEGAGDIDSSGHYAVYQKDGEKGKFRNYTVNFFDYDVKELGGETVELSKNASISSSATNNSHLAIAFSDVKLKQVSVKSFDKKGKLAGEFNLTKSFSPGAQVYFSPNGFVIVNNVYESMMDASPIFEIMQVDNQLNVLWKKELKDVNVREVVDVVSSIEGTALVYCDGKGFNKENYKQHMMRLTNDGEVLFDEVFANNYYYFPNKILVGIENTYIFGSYPVEGKSTQEGVFGIGFSKSGEMVMKKEVNYKNEISPIIREIKTDEEINMKETPQFIVNDAIPYENGFFIITETIRLRPSIGGGVQVSAGGGGSGATVNVNTTFIMSDFLVLKMDSDLKLDGIKVVTKKPNKFVVEGVVTNVNSYYKILKQNKTSNYQYWVKNNNDNISMVYTIREGLFNNIKIGVADISTSELVSKSALIESELEKMKGIDGFGVLKNIDNKLTIYVFKKGILSFYHMKYE